MHGKHARRRQRSICKTRLIGGLGCIVKIFARPRSGLENRRFDVVRRESTGGEVTPFNRSNRTLFSFLNASVRWNARFFPVGVIRIYERKSIPHRSKITKSSCSIETRRLLLFIYPILRGTCKKSSTNHYINFSKRKERNK